MSDVEAFAHYLYDDAKVAIHPDESFDNYTKIDCGDYAFTTSEAEILNLRMEECFDVCRQENVDIYEFMMQFSPIHSLMLN